MKPEPLWGQWIQEDAWRDFGDSEQFFSRRRKGRVRDIPEV